jgi:two-component system sensor histidine kinase SenX3
MLRDESEAQRVHEVRRDFVANISHELKTPIGALSLLSEAVMEAKDDSESVTKFASRMQIEAKRLTDLVQEIIQLSRVQDSDPLHEAKVLLTSDLIKESLDQCRTTADSRKINLDFQESEDGFLQGDHDQLTMAIHNLVENAINYSPPGTKVSVSTSAENGIISIAVSDQGIGIPEAEVERIFERFYRVDPARSRETGGTGLGLSIVKHIVTKHGGEISVWSSENVGSTFTIRLPIHESIEDHK